MQTVFPNSAHRVPVAVLTFRDKWDLQRNQRDNRFSTSWRLMLIVSTSEP